MINIDYSKDVLFDALGLRRLQESYMRDDETSPQQRFAFIAEQFSSDPGHAQRMYDYMSNHWVSNSTPILSFGKVKGSLPISCYLSWLDDTSEGLLNTQMEVNQLSMLGGGVGVGMGIRSVGGKSAGAIAHAKTYDVNMLAYKQGRTRRGSYAAFLDINHPEIVSFIEMRKPTGDPAKRCNHLNYGINISDEFMQIIEALEYDENYDDTFYLKDPNGDVKGSISAKRLWQLILDTRKLTGFPYLHFIDTSNRYLPGFLKRHGLKIRQTNLCVAPETLILTDKGNQVISDLEGQDVNVWNGEEWSKVTVFKTSPMEKVVTVTCDDGASIDCTNYHKWYVITRNNLGKVIGMEEKRTHELKIGDELIKADSYETVEHGDRDIEYPYESGFLTGYGCERGRTTDKHGDIALYNTSNKKLLEDVFKGYSSKCVYEGSTVFRYKFGTLLNKFDIPSNSYKIEHRLSWLAGLLDADGCALKNGESFLLNTSNQKFANNLKLFLQELGVDCTCGLYSSAKTTAFSKKSEPNFKEVNRNPLYVVRVQAKGVTKLLELGLNCHRLQLTPTVKKRKTSSKFVKVSSIIDFGRETPVYCFSEPKRHMGMFNGMLTGQCTEVILPTDVIRTAVCCLLSFNLEYYDEWKDNELIVEDCARYLDNVITYFINNAPDTISRAKFSAFRERSIGLGTLGFHAYLQKNNIPFESALAVSANLNIFKNIKSKADKANLKLGAELGEAPDAVGTGLRFSHMMSIAPNASSSIILGNASPSIEPYRANGYRQDTMSGIYFTRNKYLDSIIKEEAKNNPEGWYEEVWSSIISHRGSCQQLDFLTDWQKDVFKTFDEIKGMWIIQHAADRQPFIDQAQSVNIFAGNNMTVKEMHDIHFQAWKRGLKTLYYCRSEKSGSFDKLSHKIERQRLEEGDPEKEVMGLDSSSCLACE